MVALTLVVAACAGDEPTTEGISARSVADATADESADESGPASSDDEGGDSVGPEPTTEPAPVSTSPPDPEPTESPEPTPAPIEEPTPQPVIATSVETVTYDDDFATSIQPIITEKCANCHGAGGPGAAHWQITTAQDLVDSHVLLRGAVESDFMPPWPASDASLVFKDNRDLRPDQVAAIVAWSEAGGPLDVDPATPIEATDPVVGLADPDLVLTPNLPYAGSPNTVDDYRCQIYDPQLPDGGWITGYEFVPDQTTVVHHAIGYVIDQGRADRAAARDGEDGRPGWECYGSSGLGGDDLFFGWAPGQDASVMPEGSGLYLPPGSFLVVQIHYHYEAEAPADLSALALTVADGARDALDAVEVATLIAPAEIPCAEWEDGPLCDRDAAIADAIERFGNEGVRADQFNSICGYQAEDFAVFTQGVASSDCAIPAGFIGATGEVIAVLGHMHEIGDWMRMTLNPGRPDEQVLLDIPDWDFDWQYNYVPADRLVLDDTDVVLLECGWDRARRDPSLEPAYVLWADGTNDEMCFATITVRR